MKFFLGIFAILLLTVSGYYAFHKRQQHSMPDIPSLHTETSQKKAEKKPELLNNFDELSTPRYQTPAEPDGSEHINHLIAIGEPFDPEAEQFPVPNTATQGLLGDLVDPDNEWDQLVTDSEYRNLGELILDVDAAVLTTDAVVRAEGLLGDLLDPDNID